MEVITHIAGAYKIAELQADTVLLDNADNALQIFVDLYYQDYERVIVHEKNIIPAFFDLSSGIAGEILQKCSNYKMHMYIVGDFEKYPGKSIRDFIFESNKGKLVNFHPTVAAALEKFNQVK
ncbi:uncharacterized protein DUF4180 [Chitinophaga dinghuensis]|uniref:Uncharacterized protein DUF4180 n=1 Tax=Chitinophaga dinghuensis TaxID=1539050 RepID=A0A327VI41_9BACT|nr:DUF4180 domain-containing protein [Chitinophaga dinghuensis]RAJ73746.1 uncharacterized protein DUF4180 [Chitinophaga dinghuensis]